MPTLVPAILTPPTLFVLHAASQRVLPGIRVRVVRSGFLHLHRKLARLGLRALLVVLPKNVVTDGATGGDSVPLEVAPGRVALIPDQLLRVKKQVRIGAPQSVRRKIANQTQSLESAARLGIRKLGRRLTGNSFAKCCGDLGVHAQH